MKLTVWMLPVMLMAVPVSGEVLAQATQARPAPGSARMMRVSSDQAFIAREIGAVMTEGKGVIKVVMIPPKEQRPAELQDVDLVIGDEVGMAAGKRIKTIQELRDAYANAPVGEVFKLGVRRGEQARVVPFVKKDEKEFGATKIGGTLTLELVRNEKQVVVSAPRPEPKGPVIMRRN